MNKTIATSFVITAVFLYFIESSSQSGQEHNELYAITNLLQNLKATQQQQGGNQRNLEKKQLGRLTGPLPWQPESPEYRTIYEIPGLEVPPGRPKSYQGKIFGMEKDGVINPIKKDGACVLLIQPHNTVELVSEVHWLILYSNYCDEEKARRQALKNAVAAVHAGKEGVVYHEPQRPSPVWNPNEI